MTASTAMKERPILFSAPMVRALLNGSKTQSRRLFALSRTREWFVLDDRGAGWQPYQSDAGSRSNERVQTTALPIASSASGPAGAAMPW
jgi:hypothetical protein